MKHFITFLLIICLSISAFAQSFSKSLEPEDNQFVIYVDSCDWGACISKIILKSESIFEPASVRKEDFAAERMWNSKETNLKIVKGPLTITDAYCSDAKGNKVSSKSHYITLLTRVHPEAENASPFVGYIAGGVFEKYYSYRVTNEYLDMKITNLKGFVNEDIARFKKNQFTHENLTLEYMSYLPEKKSSEKIPLILWFHGIGESGHNPYQVLFGTKASALGTEKIQHYFKNGVAIVAPQCPTGWLETTEEMSSGLRYWAPVDIDGTAKKITNPIKKFLNKFVDVQEKEEENKPFAAVSYYTEPVTELLMDFLDSHPEIDRNRIYVGGCSAGGYMTMNMMIQHPEIFAAAFPTCEYYLDSKISNDQIKQLAKKPLWFTYALNDETVKPQNNSLPTIKRLKAADAKNLKVSEFPDVRDSELSYEYDGHYSWIYVLNDKCRDEQGVSLFDWLSRQQLK